MKIVCDACSAKYSIADEKVKGKVFKIRCKKCSNIIVVRGNAGAAAEEPAPVGQQFDQKETRVYDYGGGEGGEAPPGGDDAVWHVVIDQEQVGPISVAEVAQKFAAGEIDAETYIWREGFADWLPLSQVPDFASVVAGGGASSQGSAGADAVSSMFGATNFDEGGTSRSDPNDVFAAHAAKAAADEQDEGADDLFGQSARKGKAADAGFGAGKAASPAASAASPSNLKGQRSENSVLFSLNNLAALASDSPKAAPVAAASSSGGSSSGTAQHGGGEGSGLIDIRSMASAYLGASKGGGAAPAAGGPKVGSIDDLPVFSTAAFSEPAVIIPSVGAGRRDNKLMYALLGAVALLAIVLVIVVVVLVTGDKKGGGEGQVAMGGASGSDRATGKGSNDVLAGSATDPGSGSASASGADPGSNAGGGDGSGSASAADPGSGSASAKPPEDRGSSRGGSSSSDRGGSSGSSKGSSSGGSSDSGGGGKCLDEVACLLADKPPACCSKYRGGGGSKPSGGGGSKPSGGGSSNLPEDLQKADISAGISKVRSRVEGCAAKSSAKGTVKVSVKVAGSGAVSSVTVKESPDSALGSCVASAVQKATFAKTQNGGSFSYPFTFR